MRPLSREARQPEAAEQPTEPVVTPRQRSSGLLDAPPKTTFLLGLFAGIAVTAVAFFLIGTPGSADSNTDVKGAAVANTNTSAQPAAPTDDATKIAKPSSDDHYRGAEPSKAKVVLVEYSDFQCPYCDQLHPTLERIVQENSDTVSWIFREFPLTSIHPQAQSAALAAECAGEQGKFWEYGDKLFDNQSTLGSDLYASLAKDLGLNEKKFSDCLSSAKYQSKITDSMNEADAAGVTGTPATFVMKGTDLTTGQLVSGALPYDSFNSAISALLK